MFLLVACNDESRIPSVHSYSPGGQFSTNINSDDPRRQVRASIVFEVIDEAAVEELTEVNFIIRHTVIRVLGSLTMEDMIPERDLDELATRLVHEVNAALATHFDLIIGVYFTEFYLA